MQSGDDEDKEVDQSQPALAAYERPRRPQGHEQGAHERYRDRFSSAFPRAFPALSESA